MIPSAVARVAALLGVLAVSEGLFALAAARHAAVTVDVGPSTGAVGSGFTESEERPPLTFRWTRRGVALDWVRVEGPAWRIAGWRATIAGHLLDVAAIAAAARAARAPTAGGWWASFAFTLAALLTYVSSLFNLTALFAAFAALERRRAKPLIAIAAGAATVTVAALYSSFAVLFVREIVPVALAGGGNSAGGGALARIPLFYGLAYPLLTAALPVPRW